MFRGGQAKLLSPLYHHIINTPITCSQMKNLSLFILLLLACASNAQHQVSGYITDKKNGEALIGVSVFTAGKKSGTTTNAYGFFSISVGLNDSLYMQYIGYKPQALAVTNALMNVQLSEETGELKEAVISAEKKTSRHGATSIDLKLLNQIPAMGGERDLVKALQLMPGIKKGADGTASMLVRGGAHDQNMVLLDDAPVYNPSHLLGFFSLFNTDAVNDATIETGGFSACYGGRLSSVLDVHTIDGNITRPVYTASVGLLASRVSVQTPIFKGKGSVFVAGRISYVNKVFELAGKNLPFYFYDFNAKLNYNITNNDKLFLSFYNGDDILRESDADSSNHIKINSRMGNSISSLRWNHAFRNRHLFSNLTVFTSRYRYNIDARFNESRLKINSNIADAGLRYGFQHHLNNRLVLQYGVELIHHTFRPNTTHLEGSFNENIREQGATKQTMKENSAYLSATYHITSRLETTAGLRYSSAQNGKTFYSNPEPRIRLDYRISSVHRLSASYAKMVQYMFLLSGSSAVLPTDLWYGISENIKPQHAQIISLGYQYTRPVFVFKTEAYYKPMKQLVEYREGTTELVNGNIDSNVVQGKGEAYGIEFTAKFTQGKWSTTLGYTLSWSTRKFNELNNGERFFARYDRRHDLSIITSYEVNKRISITGIWCYATGSRFTPVTGYFMMPNGNYSNIDMLPIYSGRNTIQLSASHRLDLNIIIKNNPAKKYRTEWHIGAYNLYNQTQPFRIKMYKNSDGSYSYKQTGLFGFIPSVSFQVNF